MLVAAVQGQRGERPADHVRRADAVAGVAGGGEGAAAAQRHDHRQVGRRGVDRASPGVGEAALAEAREVVAEVGGGEADDIGVQLGAAAQARAHRDPAPAPAEHDPAVGGGAEVVEQGAAVGDALAAGPADLLQQVRDGLGEDDVGGGDRDPVAQRPPRARRRPPHRQHGGAGADRAGGGAGLDPPGPSRSEATGEDSQTSTPLAQQPLAEAERQPGRLHRRRAGVEGAAAEGRRGAAGGDLGRRERLDRVDGAELAAGRQRLGPDPVVGGRGGDLEVAGAAEPGVDSLALAELPDLGDRVLGGAGDGQRRLVPPALPHVRQREPHHVGEAAVAPARPAPAAVRLEQDHAGLGLERLDLPGRPHPREAAADHDHVGAALPDQLRRRLDLAGLLQPVAVRVCFIEDECAQGGREVPRADGYSKRAY